jgi:hypothetical protein
MESSVVIPGYTSATFTAWCPMRRWWAPSAVDWRKAWVGLAITSKDGLELPF